MLNMEEQYARDKTEKSLRHASIIIANTDFFMELSLPGAGRFAARLKKYLALYQKSIRFPYHCLTELDHHIYGSNAEKARQAVFALGFVEELYSEGFLSVHGDSAGLLSTLDDDFADPIIKSAALTLFQKENVLVLTQDNDLCWDILTHRSVQSPYSLIIKSVSHYGWLKNPKAFYDYRTHGGISDEK